MHLVQKLKGLTGLSAVIYGSRERTSLVDMADQEFIGKSQEQYFKGELENDRRKPPEEAGVFAKPT